MKAAVVIPARYGSTRFPGKALIKDPAGKPLLQYVYEAAHQAERVNQVIVATDDERIYAVVQAFGGEARMTAAHHRCGSDRVAEVAAHLSQSVVVNLQGDEPSIRPQMITQVIELLDQAPECAVATLAARVETEQELADANVVKVVLDESSRALYFSRAPIPFVRDAAAPLADSPVPHLRHLGIYAYRRPFLLEYAHFGPHPLEEAEKLEQLRILAHGHMIAVGLTEHRTFKVDTPEDFDAFIEEFKRRKAEQEG